MALVTLFFMAVYPNLFVGHMDGFTMKVNTYQRFSVTGKI